MEDRKVIAIDFDGVLHKASEGNKKGAIYDEPVEGAVFTTKNLAKKYKLVVMTSRPVYEHEKVKKWLDENGFPEMEVSNIKPTALAYIDDRGIRFTSWSDIVHYFL